MQDIILWCQKMISLINENNDKYEEKIEIDIKQYNFMMVYNSPLDDIAKHMKKIKVQQELFQSKVLE